MVQRRDKGSLRKPVLRGDGTARVDAYLTRVGIFEYLNADGSIRRELRTPEEVFNADSLESFEGVPLTDDHPEGAVHAGNARELARGAVGDTVKRDGDFVRSRLTVLDEALVAKMVAGKVELSCGYTCDLDPTPGMHPLFGRYDAKQMNIRGNHVAVVDSGRAGPEVRARMDAGGAAMVAGAPSTKEIPRMETVKKMINGVEYDVSPQVAQAIDAERAPRADAANALKAAQTRADELTGELNGVKAKLDTAAVALKAATDPAVVAKAVAARVALEQAATAFEVKTDGKTDREVKTAIVKAAIKLDVAADAPEAELEGSYKAAMASVGVEALAKVRVAAGKADTAKPGDELANARARMIAHNESLRAPKESK